MTCRIRRELEAEVLAVVMESRHKTTNEKKDEAWQCIVLTRRQSTVERKRGERETKGKRTRAQSTNIRDSLEESSANVPFGWVEGERFPWGHERRLGSIHSQRLDSGEWMVEGFSW